MASVTYESIFKLFLGNITDYKLASLEENDATDLMKEYLHKALGATYLRKLFSSITLDDDTMIVQYTMAQATDAESDSEFVTTAIAKWMTYEWIHNQVNSVVNTAQFFGGSEQKYYSQANHISELRELHDLLYKEARHYVMDRGWIHNSYLGG